MRNAFPSNRRFRPWRAEVGTLGTARASAGGQGCGLRIILDTNVALSALLWRGKPYRLLETLRLRSDIRLFSSPALMAELADVLARPSPAKQVAVIGRSAREVL